MKTTVLIILSLCFVSEAWQATHHRPRVSIESSRTVRTATEQVAQSPSVETTPRAEWETFRWRENWYPIVFTKTTDKKKPTRVELFGDPIVLWFDHVENRWAAMLDRCPHRLAPLSEGRVDEQGQIECVRNSLFILF